MKKLFEIFPFLTKKELSAYEGIGDIRISILKPEVFEKINDGWILLNGRAIEQNWDLYSLYNNYGLFNDPIYSEVRNNLPDARGVFIRGMQVNREDGKGGHEANRPVGKYQKDALLKHLHKINNNLYETGFGTGKGGDYGLNSNQGIKTEQNEEGDENETRPQNINLYIYMKVHN